MTVVPNPAGSSAEIILSYHERTKHRLERYAAGPETLDWSAQPNPFREFSGAKHMLLPLGAAGLATPFGDIYKDRAVTPFPLDKDNTGTLLQLSMALNAWKEYGPDRWALRCNPSSGNLHPTEAYVLARGIPGIVNGVHHYLSRDHSLEHRGQFDEAALAPGGPQLWIGLSSVHWREAWKYGERAFRYCQLDVGHAIGALRYAAGALGWTLQMAEGLSSAEISGLLGIDRETDFSGGAEKEAPDLILRVIAGSTVTPLAKADSGFSAAQISQWTGKANILDRWPMYKWPVIEEASLATRKTKPVAEPPYRGNFPGIGEGSPEPAVSVILNRRSAQGFDRNGRMGSGAFYHLIDRLLTRDVAPWDVWTYAPRLHPVFFVHRVDGLEPGLYILIRNPEAEMGLRKSMHHEFVWKRPEHVPPQLNFYQLLPADCAKVARTVNCHQAIASDSFFAMAMMAEFEPIVRSDPWRYKQLHWEAGLIGQVLYLEAETLGFRGTGIGCYFDDAIQEILGLKDAAFTSLYGFTVGQPLVDNRITTLPPYQNRQEADETAHAAGAIPQQEAPMTEEATFQRINVETAKQVMTKGEVLVVDMRDPGSYESGHIEGAEHITEANIFNFLSTTPKNTPVIVYCYHGNASQVYAKTFADFHFKEVYSLDGGYEGWRKSAG